MKRPKTRGMSLRAPQQLGSDMSANRCRPSGHVHGSVSWAPLRRVVGQPASIVKSHKRLDQGQSGTPPEREVAQGAASRPAMARLTQNQGRTIPARVSSRNIPKVENET